jgi:hypothetical protein
MHDSVTGRLSPHASSPPPRDHPRQDDHSTRSPRAATGVLVTTPALATLVGPRGQCASRTCGHGRPEPGHGEPAAGSRTESSSTSASSLRSAGNCPLRIRVGRWLRRDVDARVDHQPYTTACWSSGSFSRSEREGARSATPCDGSNGCCVERRPRRWSQRDERQTRIEAMQIVRVARYHGLPGTASTYHHMGIYHVRGAAGGQQPSHISCVTTVKSGDVRHGLTDEPSQPDLTSRFTDRLCQGTRRNRQPGSTLRCPSQNRDHSPVIPVQSDQCASIQSHSAAAHAAFCPPLLAVIPSIRSAH